MSNIISATCQVCGNTDTAKFKHYDGALGYESITCQECGWFTDHAGYHPPENPEVNQTRIQHIQQQTAALQEIAAGNLDDEPEHRFITRARRVAKDAIGWNW